jgi:hypothetical protein
MSASRVDEASCEEASLPFPLSAWPPHAPSDAALAVDAAAPNINTARVAFVIDRGFGARLRSTSAPQNGHVS